MNYQALFASLGYPKHTDRVYETILAHETALSVTILSHRLRVSRMTIYRCLQPLLADDVVHPVAVGRRTHYCVGNPAALLKVMQTLAQTGETGAQLMCTHTMSCLRGVRVLSGPTGIRAVFDDVIAHMSRGGTFFRYTSERDLDRVNQYLAADYRQRRDRKRLERKVISNYTSGRQKHSRLERFIKFIPLEHDQFEQNIIQLIYGSRLAFIDLNREEAIIIDNSQLADFQKVIFTALYKQL